MTTYLVEIPDQDADCGYFQQQYIELSEAKLAARRDSTYSAKHDREDGVYVTAIEQGQPIGHIIYFSGRISEKAGCFA